MKEMGAGIMVDHTNRNYSVSEVREIVSMACTVSNLSSEHIMGMVCLADLLTHIDTTPDDAVESQVRNFFANLHSGHRSGATVAFDDIDD